MTAAAAANPFVDSATVALVKAAEEREAALAKLPKAIELFPGMRQQVAEYFMFQLAAQAMQRPAFGDALHWWNEAMNERDRRFVLRIARRPLELADQSWLAISLEDRCRLVATFMWVYSWANNFLPPLYPYTPCVMEP